MHGSCLCGNVKYVIVGTPRSVVACHCRQCRKSSGHYVAATQAPTDQILIEGVANIRWYQSSPSAKRGFCSTCGSQLFWTEELSRFTSIMAGTIDGDSGLEMDRQLIPESKGDYYSLPGSDVVDQSTL